MQIAMHKSDASINYCPEQKSIRKLSTNIQWCFSRNIKGVLNES
jgi:hypothetical protein